MQKKVKKMKWIMAILLIGIILLTACSQNEGYTISKDGSFNEEECTSRGLGDSVIMIESRYCSHCRDTKPTFLQACGSQNIQPELIDVATPEGTERLKELGITVQYTPTFIIGCNYYVGVQENYLEILP